MNVNEQSEKFLEFRKLYGLQHRPPKRNSRSAGDWLVYFGLLLLALSSIVVSGFHTIPTFLNTIGGNTINEIKAVATFTMIELGILIVSYIKTHDAFNKSERESINVGLRASIIGSLILLLAVGVNLRDVLLNENIFIYKFANIGIFALVGIAAPLLAFLSSELLAYYTVRNEVEHQAAVNEWEDALNRSWNANKRKWLPKTEVIQETTPTKQVTVTRYGKARAEAERYFDNFPDMLTGGTMDEIELHASLDGYKVKRGTLYKVWKERQ